ncbi:beta strand repeat-containing protein [Nocardioides daeguensis]|uniref:Bacterial Ig-like domain-containing protein n=1 Tax=Nocardioides daeguensis TaxID=908359 RepID=A0ABP6W770_9ACTN|nr:Ig-like domain-containing protein [Nocardioides daeguensis]MBV6729281.1 Ig-like domain-containing protein [Nocardioides daeguensis]MCR1774257.1 Ig-like domain-containing protein [Nocardioides daeguensis]
MLPAPIDNTLLPSGRRRPHRAFRRRMAWLSVLATIVAGLVAAAPPVQAAQATGDDVATWNPGWSWTYQTTFRYTADTADVTINENVTYSVAGIESFQGQSAYKLNISGTITGGGGTAAVDGVGNATLGNFSGSVSGTRYVRRSDLALLQEQQRQNLNAKASVSILSTNITATVDLVMTPRGGWRAIDFPVEAGQAWHNDVDVDYNGGFSYDAGSYGSGADTFDGVFALDAPAAVTNASISVPAGSIATRRVHSQSADGQLVSTHWWSPAHRNDAQEYLKLPLDGATLTLDRKLSASSTPASSTTVSTTITPSLTCAGGEVAVTGRLSTGAAGIPVTVSLDKSPATPGQMTTVTTSTTTGGNFTATLTAPAQADGLEKNGARGSWGVLVSAGTATNAATLVVTPKNCSTLTYTGTTSAPQGSTTTVRAVLADLTGGDVAGRSVTFSLPDGASATATTDAAGVAETQISVAGPPRSTTLTASYAGSGGLEAASVSTPFSVGTIATTTTVSADPSVVTVGDPVRFTASVTAQHGATPTGAVSFNVDGSDFGAPVPLSGAQATSGALSTLGLGYHTVTATYSGSGDNTASTSSPVTFRVREPLLATSTSSTVSPASAVHGQPVTLSASVSTGTGTPTGDVVFTVEGTEVGRAGVAPDGTASLTVADLPVGANPVVATYTGDDVYAGSAASPRTVTVAKAAVDVDLGASANPTLSGETVSYTATVAVQAPGGGTPTGAVQLVVDGTPTGSPVALEGGVAAFAPLTTLGAGTHTVEARYAGTGQYLPGTDQLAQVVDPASTSTLVQANPSPSVQDENVQLTASVAAVSPGSGTPTGTVTFYADGSPLGAVPLAASGAGSVATLDVDDLAPGAHQVTARYAGDADYLASESEALTHTVIAGTAVVATTTTLSSSAQPSTYGEPVSFRATVTADGDTPAGTVQFSVDGHDVGGPVTVEDGVAVSAAVATMQPGDHTVIASFVGAPGFSGSGAIVTQSVTTATAQVALSSSAPASGVGEEVRFSAEVTSAAGATPSGFVQFAVDGLAVGAAVALVDGAATSAAVSDLAPGSHTVTVLYSGDLRYGSGTAQLTQAVERINTSSTLAIDRDFAVFGDAVTLTATVTPAAGRLGSPTGTVTFTENGQVVATASLAAAANDTAVASVTVSGLGAGSHAIKAEYAGTNRFGASTSGARSITVAKQPTAIQATPAIVSLTPLLLPLGQLRATVTAGGSPLAGVPLEFRVGAKLVCTTVTNESGFATCNAATQILQLTLLGGYNVTYAGDANHLSSTAHGAILK